MDRKEFDKIRIRSGDIIISEKFGIVGEWRFIVQVVDYRRGLILGKCQRGCYWFTVDDIKEIITDE